MSCTYLAGDTSAFLPPDIEIFRSNLRSFAGLHKKYPFQPGERSSFAEVFDTLNEFVAENERTFPARFMKCGLAIGQDADEGPIRRMHHATFIHAL
jgi:hypothetical protein